MDFGSAVRSRILQADPARMILLACEQANELADGENVCLFETEYVRHSIEIRSDADGSTSTYRFDFVAEGVIQSLLDGDHPHTPLMPLSDLWTALAGCQKITSEEILRAYKQKAAASLGASNVSKVGSLIRAFELGEPLSDHWLQKLVAELQPDPTELRHCLELDQAEAAEQLERKRIAWELWADEPIEPFLTIRYIPAVYGVREVPQAFCTPRESAEDRTWARERAEDWAAAELKRFRAKGFLNWSRRERTWFDQYGVNPDRQQVSFEDRHTRAWMQLSGSLQKFLLTAEDDFRPLPQQSA